MAHEELIADGLRPVVQGVASDEARRYGRYGASVRDMARVACHWLTDHEDKLEQLRADYPKHWVSILRRILENECRLHGEAIKAHALGYKTHDVFWYTRASVERLLPLLFDPNAWQEPPVGDDEGFRQKVPGPGGGWVTLLADVSRAFGRLSSHDQLLIRLHYQADVQNQSVAEAFGVPTSTASDHRLRAVERLVEMLGGERPSVQHDASCSHEYRVGSGIVA